MIRTWFTPATARRALTRLRPEAERLHRLYLEMDARRPRRAVSDCRVDPLYWSMLERLARGIGHLRRAGLQVDDLRRGKVDFPALRAGRPVLLCWRVGEPALAYWHEPGQGTDRRPVDDCGPWDPPPGRPEPLC